MAKKNFNGRKSVGDSEEPVGKEPADFNVTRVTAEQATAVDDAPVAKPKSKVSEEQPSTGSVSLADIRKAVAFANSVGGLDKAISLLQIVKVAKEVQ